MTLGDKFNQSVSIIRKKYSISDCLSDDIDECCRRWLMVMEDKAFLKDIKMLRLKFKLDGSWQEPLMRYVVDEAILPFDRKIVPQVKVILNKSGDFETWINVTNVTGIDQVSDVLKRLLSGRPNIKDKKYKTFLRDFRIYSLTREKKSAIQISIEIEKLYPKDFPGGLSTETVKKLESKFRKRYKLGAGQGLVFDKPLLR